MALGLSLHSYVVGEKDLIMYSRDFGGIRSDGQLKEFENNWRNQYTQKEYTENSQIKPGIPYYEHSEPERIKTDHDTFHNEPPVQESCPQTPLTSPTKSLFNINLDFLKKIQIDDLILIGIGILLLLDSDANNDMLIILIAMMLFF